jgi:hypothetical protein
MSLKDEFRQERPNEEELIGTEGRIASERSVGAVTSKCPTKAQWMFFVAGKFNETRAAELGEHLAECESCNAIFTEIRSQQEVADLRIFSGKKLVFAAIAAAILVVVLLATWLMRSGVPPETAVLDLRSVTRGVDNSTDSGLVLHPNTRHLRILLPRQPAERKYEVALFDPSDLTSPRVTGTAASIPRNDSLVLEVSLPVGHFQPGPYLVGIRHDHLEWAYYTIRIH